MVRPRAHLLVLLACALVAVRALRPSTTVAVRTSSRARCSPTAQLSPFRSVRSLEKQLRSLALPDEAVRRLVGSGAKTLADVLEFSDVQLVAAGVPRKSWSAVRAGVGLLIGEKQGGLATEPPPPPVAIARAEAPFVSSESAAASLAAAAEAEAGLADSSGDPAEVVELVVEAHEAELRLDVLLAARFPSQSRTYFASLCAKQCVTVNGRPSLKGLRASAGSKVSVTFVPTEEMEAKPQQMHLEILYQDEHMLLLNKAAGLVVHPAPGNWEGTLVNGVLHYLQAARAAARPGEGKGEGLPSSRPAGSAEQQQQTQQLPSALSAEGAGGSGAEGDADEEFAPAGPASSSLTSLVVHRLDKGTSGVIAFAKSGEAQRKLSALFRLRQVRKSYLCVCVGDPGPAPIDIRHPIGRDRQQRLRMTVVPEDEGGRPARSVVHKLAHNGKFSLCRVDIFTGRTHQIRVHMRQQGLPILGDEDYGSAQWNSVALKRMRVRRPLLHAARLSFTHPFTGEEIDVEAPLPEDLALVADSIRQTPGASSLPADTAE